MSETAGNEATIHVEAEPAETDSGDVVVVVDNSGDDADHDEVQDAVDAAVETERRFAAIESRLTEVESRSYQAATYSEVVEVAQETVAEAVAESAEVAEEVSEEVAADVAEEVAEDVSPHKTHWLTRSWGEWTGRNGSGRG